MTGYPQVFLSTEICIYPRNKQRNTRTNLVPSDNLTRRSLASIGDLLMQLFRVFVSTKECGERENGLSYFSALNTAYPDGAFKAITTGGDAISQRFDELRISFDIRPADNLSHHHVNCSK